MTEPLCVCGCGRPVPDQAYAATACANRTGDLLHDIADMAIAARDVATGLARRGLSGSQSDENRLPLNLGATERLNAVQDALARQCLRIAVRRGMEYHVHCLPSCVKPSPSNAHCGTCHTTFGSVSGFDRHRRAGQCIEPEALPMHQDSRGVWRFNVDDGDSVRYRTRQSAETRSGVSRDTAADSEPAKTLSGGPA